MYDISTRNVKKGKNIYVVFLAVGFIFLAFLVYQTYTTHQKEASLDSSTTSTRVEITSYENDEGTTMYSPIYYYVVDNQEYRCSSITSSSISPSTKNDTVYYEKANPSNCMSNYSKKGNKWNIIFLIIPIIFILVSVINFYRINKRVKKIEKLNQTGKLVKNLPYHLEETKISVNNVPILRPVVNYTLSSGTTIILYGDPRYDRKKGDEDGMIDLVIDEKNPDNYFLDYSINRIGGNLVTDYYNNQQELNGFDTETSINKETILGRDNYNPSNKY